MSKIEKSKALMQRAAGNPLALLQSQSQLTLRERTQILNALTQQSYDIAVSYIWAKTSSSLKRELEKLGVNFIAEMLGKKSDLYSSTDQLLTDYEALNLSIELGILNTYEGIKLKHARELHDFYFNNSNFESDDLEDEETPALEAFDAGIIISSCMIAVLTKESSSIGLDFKAFRNNLENATLSEDSNDVIALLNSPYFFKMTATKVLMSLSKTAEGVALERILANAAIIIPGIWDELKKPEKYLIGETYRDVTTDGNNKASSGLRTVLLKVKGFDFVPENLRSQSFWNAANELLRTHFAIDNYYHEPKKVKMLSEMGKIPQPALAECITSTLCIRLGNAYGISTAAQPYAEKILGEINLEQWRYYLEERFSTDAHLLPKLSSNKPFQRWREVVSKYKLDQLELLDNKVKRLINATRDGDSTAVARLAEQLLEVAKK